MKFNVDFIYPVGSIYMSVNSINPSKWFGGTWVAWGSGKVPVGVDTTQTEFNTVEKTGGEKTHTLTIQEMPSHSHRFKLAYGDGGNENTGFAYPGTTVGLFDGSSIALTGGNQAHNNLQPYITCYMWKRTS